ncbi:HNH endonuclease [Streptomyces sp. NPDC006711]|uniref:HNH endonuclease n=1 Tax=unclassified Streptomyces TaxID=2593676 RepID=UPI00340FC77B
MAGRYTRALVMEAARETRHMDDAVRWCGGVPTPGSRRYLRQRMAQAGIDISHFATNQVRHTEERLRAAVAVSSNIKDVVRHLGINQVGGNQTHISRRIAALGIDTGHFTRTRRGRPKGSLGDVLGLRDPEDGRVPGGGRRYAFVAHAGAVASVAGRGNRV